MVSESVSVRGGDKWFTSWITLCAIVPAPRDVEVVWVGLVLQCAGRGYGTAVVSFGREGSQKARVQWDSSSSRVEVWTGATRVGASQRSQSRGGPAKEASVERRDRGGGKMRKRGQPDSWRRSRRRGRIRIDIACRVSGRQAAGSNSKSK